MVKITNSISLRSRFIRKTILYYMDLPFNKKTGFLENFARLSHIRRMWICPFGYTLKKYNVDGLPLEELVKKNGIHDKVILQFHGGAYVMRFFDQYRILAHKYSRMTKGATVVSIDYHTAPNHVFPEALVDALKAWDWLLKRGYKEENIIVVGDSAGGNLALALTMKLRDDGRKLPKGLVLMSPWTDLAVQGESYMYNQTKDPLFGRKPNQSVTKAEQMKSLILSYAGDVDYFNKYLSPAYGEYDNFPPMLIQVGTDELIESDSITVYEKAKKAGVEAYLTRYYGMFHDFQQLYNLLPESKQAWDEVQDFIESRWKK